MNEDDFFVDEIFDVHKKPKGVSGVIIGEAKNPSTPASPVNVRIEMYLTEIENLNKRIRKLKAGLEAANNREKFRLEELIRWEEQSFVVNPEGLTFRLHEKRGQGCIKKTKKD